MNDLPYGAYELHRAYVLESSFYLQYAAPAKKLEEAEFLDDEKNIHVRLMALAA